jgi:hypothetical protein
LFEDSLILINFREEGMRVDFSDFDELLPFFFKRFSFLISEEKTLLIFFKKLDSISPHEPFMGEIEQSLKDVLFVHSRITSVFPIPWADIGFSREHAWNENLFEREGVIRNSTGNVSRFYRIKGHHTTCLLM